MVLRIGPDTRPFVILLGDRLKYEHPRLSGEAPFGIDEFLARFKGEIVI